MQHLLIETRGQITHDATCQIYRYALDKRCCLQDTARFREGIETDLEVTQERITPFQHGKGFFMAAFLLLPFADKQWVPPQHGAAALTKKDFDCDAQGFNVPLATKACDLQLHLRQQRYQIMGN